ncbi:MAG: hypothetical protein IKL40_01870 [Clostridia bacterium]|nr:hypothetical protein [Clostridia bacterium]
MKIKAFFIRLLFFFIRKENTSPKKKSIKKKRVDDLTKKLADKNVLVGVLRNTSQLGKCLRGKFYHIPTDQVPGYDLDSVKYVAIYQSRRFFGDEAGIRYYGEVASYEIVKRKSIKEIRSDSEEDYVYFTISSWYELESPVKAKEWGFVGFLTSFYLLENSSELPELFIDSKEEYKVYHGLVDLVKKLKANGIKDHKDIRIFDFTVKIHGGLVELYMKNELQISDSFDEFLNESGTFVKEIFSYYPELSCKK